MLLIYSLLNIRINGEFISPQNVPSASNDYQMDVGNVSYPRMPTVSIERERVSQQNAQNNNFNELYLGLFNNLFGENNTPHQIEMKIYMVSMVMDHLLLMIMPHLYLLH